MTDISSSRDLIKLCYGDRSKSIPRFELDSEEQYFRFQKKAWEETMTYIDNNLSKNPFEAIDHPANVGTNTENESDTDYAIHKAKAIHRDKVKETFSKILMSNFEISMRCPFSKEFQDCSDLHCCMIPERKCKSKTFENFDKFKTHAWGKSDV